MSLVGQVERFLERLLRIVVVLLQALKDQPPNPWIADRFHILQADLTDRLRVMTCLPAPVGLLPIVGLLMKGP